MDLVVLSMTTSPLVNSTIPELMTALKNPDHSDKISFLTLMVPPSLHGLMMASGLGSGKGKESRHGNPDLVAKKWHLQQGQCTTLLVMSW
eukprot:6458879-Ditylum_brightwellii.AAC.1